MWSLSQFADSSASFVSASGSPLFTCDNWVESLSPHTGYIMKTSAGVTEIFSDKVNCIVSWPCNACLKFPCKIIIN